MTEKEELRQMTEYLLRNRSKFNLSDVAERLNVSQSEMSLAVHGKKNTKGTFVKIPKRCIPELRKYIEELKFQLKEEME